MSMRSDLVCELCDTFETPRRLHSITQTTFHCAVGNRRKTTPRLPGAGSAGGMLAGLPGSRLFPNGTSLELSGNLQAIWRMTASRQ